MLYIVPQPINPAPFRLWFDVFALHFKGTRSGVPEEYGDGDRDWAPAGRDGWHGPDLRRSTGHDLSLAVFNEAGSKLAFLPDWTPSRVASTFS
jgi:hypothetical protein